MSDDIIKKLSFFSIFLRELNTFLLLENCRYIYWPVNQLTSKLFSDSYGYFRIILIFIKDAAWYSYIIIFWILSEFLA
jgi:hypothetical protein